MSELSKQIELLKSEIANLNKRLDDREIDLIEAKREERERIRKLFEDKIAPFVSLKDTTRLYSFWQALKEK